MINLDRFIVPNNLNQFSFIDLDTLSKKAIIRKGSWLFENSFYLKNGYKLSIEPGAKINFVNGSFIFVDESPVDIIGSKVDSIYMFSSDSSGMGLYVRNSLVKSEINYLSFKNMRGLNYLNGAINFYNSDVYINNSVFTNNYSEDAVNIIESNFTIENSRFYGIASDAIDIDFGYGEIKNCIFGNINNDAIDVSGSKVLITHCDVSNAGDKAISCGEASTVTISSINLLRCGIGIAKKR